MTGDAYLQIALARHTLKPSAVVPIVTAVIVPSLRQWAGVWLNEISYIGSVAKGTGISGTTDLDIFVSLRPNTPYTLADIYNSLFRWAANHYWIPRPQNVSIGITFLGTQIDLVPGRLQEGYKYYHSVWKRKAGTWTQTAPAIHIDKVRDSGRTREIRAIKIWRKNHRLDFPSFYLELTVINALSGRGSNLANNVQHVLHDIATNLTTARVEDPANTNNIVSDDLTPTEKLKIAAQARRSYSEKYWQDTLW